MEAGESTPVVTEIPSYLKQLAKYIARGFYQVEDYLIVDTLVRNTCMKEKDIEECLKFDLKLLRSRMSTLKNDKFVQVRLRVETGVDGRAQKVSYYFINYKSLVNVIKYKLDHIRKRMETQERDATNRASFKCTNCSKTFTDLEAGELFDFVTEAFYCTFCKQPVEEDTSATPQRDSRVLLARFNEQMQVVFELLKKAESIKLAPELLEPEPPRIIGDMTPLSNDKGNTGSWSGEATRNKGFNDQTHIDIKIGDDINKSTEEKKERPIWMQESTIGSGSHTSDGVNRLGSEVQQGAAENVSRDEIMSVLLTCEKKGGTLNKPIIPGEESDSEGEEPDPDNMTLGEVFEWAAASKQEMKEEVENEVGLMESDEDESIPMVSVGNTKIPLTDVDDEIVAQMTESEKEVYIQLYQDYYSHMMD